MPGSSLTPTLHPLAPLLIRWARNLSSVVAFELALIARIFWDRCLVGSDLTDFCILNDRQITQSKRNVGNRFIG
jgi:hypothetical protein